MRTKNIRKQPHHKNITQRTWVRVSLLGLGTALLGPVTLAAQSYVLQNQNVFVTLSISNGHVESYGIRDKKSGRTIRITNPFSLTLANGTHIAVSSMKAEGSSITALRAQPETTIQALHENGHAFCAQLSTQELPAHVHWCIELRDSSRYVRQTLQLEAEEQPIPLTSIQMLTTHDASAHVAGNVAGSPVIDDTAFFGFEHPKSQSAVRDGDILLSLTRVLPLQSHQSITYSGVVGFSDPGQMRRDFLTYLERERAHAYRTFLTYNTWFDLGFGERYTAEGAIDRVNAFGHELVKKRGVTLDSYLFDDGWDDPHTLWKFDSGFPNGFTPVSTAAQQYHAGIGVWLSPWGGYDQAKQQRIAYGKAHDLEIVKNGYALSGPKYYKAFEDACLQMIDRYRVNQFKFDGTGNADQVFPGSVFDSDFDAAIHLIGRLRKDEPNVFINLTTGTYPSPWWLQYADSIWRGGEDHAFAGVGTWRQKWMTYRDGQTYKNIVERGPLFPLNSLMLHGIIYAKQAEHVGDDPEHDFPAEVWSYFGSGTDMQELYITPSLLKSSDWDTLADGAKWARDNANVLRDSHWIGGDPEALQIYGWAAWTRGKGIVTLRNPSDHSQQFQLDPARALQLPTTAPHTFSVHVRWKSDGQDTPVAFKDGVPQTITLKPFSVAVMELIPR